MATLASMRFNVQTIAANKVLSSGSARLKSEGAGRAKNVKAAMYLSLLSALTLRMQSPKQMD